MSATRSKLASGVYVYCDNAPDLPRPDGLPLSLVFEVLSDTEDEMLRDYDLSDQNRRVRKLDINLSSSDFGISRSDFQSPSYAFLRTDATSEDWYPVEIVNHANLVEAGREGKLAIAFYGTPRRAGLSWEAEAGQTLRIWHDRSGEDSPRLSGETEIDSLYDSYLKLRAAAQCRELIGLPNGPVMASRIAKSEGQWMRSVRSSRQQGLAEKTRVYTPPRLRSSVPRFRMP